MWYDVLFQVNRASKLLQSPSVSINTLTKEIDAIKKFLEDYRKNGFKLAKLNAQQIADEMEIEQTFHEKRLLKKRLMFDYECEDNITATTSPEFLFQRDFFYLLIDFSIIGLHERFLQLEFFYNLFGFLYSRPDMVAIPGNPKCCSFVE